MTATQTASEQIKPRRSLLFVPAVRLEMFPKALNSGADIVCVDLEDSVAEDKKETSRAASISAIASNNVKNIDPKKEIWIRINPVRSSTGLEDIIALFNSDIVPNGIMIPKVTSPEEIRILRDIISIKHPELTFHPLIETSNGLKQANEIAKSSHKVGSIIFGGFDMAANLRVEPSWNGLLFARGQLALAAANANIDLLDMPHFKLDDLSDLKKETQAAIEIGFTGKCAIHPKQIDIINDAFTPTNAEIEKARNLISKFEAQDQGFAEIEGILMEKPVVQRLYRTLAIAERIAK